MDTIMKLLKKIAKNNTCAYMYSEEEIDATNTLLLLRYGHTIIKMSMKQLLTIHLHRPISPSFSQHHHFKPVLPLNFKTKIQELNGSAETETVFVFEKTLYKSYVSMRQNRFLIPLK